MMSYAGKGRPCRLIANQNQAGVMSQARLPSADDAIRSFQQQGGMLGDPTENSISQDPLKAFPLRRLDIFNLRLPEFSQYLVLLPTACTNH